MKKLGLPEVWLDPRLRGDDKNSGIAESRFKPILRFFFQQTAL